MSLADRIRERVEVREDGCHIFTGALTAAGYGVVGLGGRSAGVGYTHRLIYEAVVGPIPDGLHIDHLCRVRACCNPDHLEAVTQAENNRRAAADNKAARTTCSRGHEWTPENTLTTKTQRYCRTCRNARARAKRSAA